MATLQHPDIGEIKGSQCDGAVQYLGIPFATLKDRISPPKLKTTYESPINDTEFGPCSIGPSFGYGLEQSFIQYEIPRPPVSHSDLGCLNLNVTVPNGKHAKLPVLVWVHGGGFVNGSNHWPTYDHAKLVKLAAEASTPIIGVNINYRLGMSGLITSEELRKAGYKSNNSLRDQRVAFHWVQKFISGFGGDPDNITAIGESIGAVTVALQLCSKERLFDRAALFGGSSLLLRPPPLAYHEGVYQKTLEALKITDKPLEEKLKVLNTTPIDQVWADVPISIGFALALDGDMVPEAPTFDTISDKNGQLSNSVPGRQWCKSIMVSDCQFDGSAMLIIMGHLKANAAKRFTNAMNQGLSDYPGAADKIFSAYGITGPDQDDDSAFMGAIRFLTDIGFHAPTLAFAQGWSGHSYLACFNEPNPWEGPCKGEAGHVLDVAFLFQNYNDQLPPAQAASAEQLGKDVAEFVSGKEPWLVYSAENPGANVYGPSSWDRSAEEPSIQYVKSISDGRAGRNKPVVALGKEVGLDNIAKAWGLFQTSSP